MWDDRSPLHDLLAGSPKRILDVGAGTGEFTRVLREESEASVIPLDADVSLLKSGDRRDGIQGAATELPFRDNSLDLVGCQALLVNVPDPEAVLSEFSRVASDRVGAVEPDNTAVTVESSAPAESALAQRAREAYMAGLETDSGIGAELRAVFESVGLGVDSITRMTHERTIEPPYTEQAVESARRKVVASRLDDHREVMLDGGLSVEAFDTLRDEWQAMGRTVVEQMRSDDYRRVERIPFYVGVGSVTF